MKSVYKTVFGVIMGNQFETIIGSEAWMGRDFLGNDDWVFRLEAKDLREIKFALDQAIKKGLPFHQVSEKEFPLPGLRNAFGNLVNEVGNGRGFVVIKGIPVESYNENEIKYISLGLCSYFGKLIPQSIQGDWINHVIDLSDQKEAPKPELDHIIKRKQLRTNHRGGELDFHTDTTDVFALFCLRSAKAGGTSRLVSTATLHNLIGKNNPKYLKALYDGYFYMSRPDDNVKSASKVSAKRVPVFKRVGSKVDGYYISQVVQRAVDHGGVHYTAIENDAREELQRVANRPGIAHEFDLEPGDLLVANNRAVFHARYDYEDHPEVDRRRHLFRLWMANTPEMMSKTFVSSSERYS